MKSEKAQIKKLTRTCAIQHEALGKLKELIKINSIINSSDFDLNRLLVTIMKTTERVMGAEASSLMLIDEKTQELVYQVALGEKGKYIKEKFRLKIGQGIAGWVAQHEKALVVPDVTKDSRFYSKPDQESGFKTRSIICVPLKTRNKTIGIIQAINPLNKPGFTHRDLPIFKAFSTQAAVAIENAKVHHYRLQEQRLRNELEIAQKIQQNLLPHTMPLLNGFQCWAKNISARMVGGDLYDFILLKNNRLGVLIGDVSGKGIPAALFMVAMLTNLRSLAQTTDEPSEIFTKLNRNLHDESSFGMFVTAVFLLFDFSEMRVTYTNAGHFPPYMVNRHTSSVKELPRASAPPLGMLKNIKYTQTAHDFTPDDLFFLYTDGVTEARGSHHTDYGANRLLQTIKQAKSSPKHLVEGVFQSVRDFAGKTEQHDDITLVSAGYVQ